MRVLWIARCLRRKRVVWEFNTTGLCVPERHYMVDVSGRVEQVRAMVERGDYFCVRRARQYGKTTILTALERALEGDFAVASLDFQQLSHTVFATEGSFVAAFANTLLGACDLGRLHMPEDVAQRLEGLANKDPNELRLSALFRTLRAWVVASERPVVLIVDEVDDATNNQAFLDFLAQLRLQYLSRAKNPSYPAFQSVALAGVTDVRHLRSRIRPEETSRTNSPWNIAADFDVRMSFDEADVTGMLRAYEADHATGMDAAAVAHEVVSGPAAIPSSSAEFVCSSTGTASAGTAPESTPPQDCCSRTTTSASSSRSRASWRRTPPSRSG